MFRVSKREHLAFYSLASMANLFLSVPQFQAVNSALQLGVHLQGTTGRMISQDGSVTGLLLEFTSEILIFQGILAASTIGIGVMASTLTKRKWQYSLSAILMASYVAYHLGGKFLNTLQWIGVLELSGMNVASVYGDLFWFGLLATICYLLSILLLRRSQGNIAITSPNRVI